MKVDWTNNAVDHLVNIYEYISLNSPIYATRMVDRLTRRSEQIADYPLSGRKVPEYDVEDIRELIEKPYRIIYRIKQGTSRDVVDELDLILGFSRHHVGGNRFDGLPLSMPPGLCTSVLRRVPFSSR